ncbi:twin-arginine translocation signal domain-containing protein [bacterium]|nr:MAG: twin-arginine translocation signal domain-containing protein [bacterium]
MSENNGKEISRRDFLKLAGGALGAGILGGMGLGDLIRKTPDVFHKEPLALTPEVVDGVEVYGLKEKITSADTVERFYAYLDDQFARANHVWIVDKVRQRKEVLNPNERYLEVVVRRCAYDSFVQKQAETGVSFPEWIKIHVDVMNRCLKTAKPSVEMKAVLRRILVVEDEATKGFWDENAFRQGGALGSALDCAWVEKFYPFSFDTDDSWAVADDYRDSGGGKFWEFRHEDGKTIIGSPPGKVPFDYFYEFSEENDSLSGKNNIGFDMGLIHEWSHYLLNLPDEYAQDVHDASQRFKDFTFGTGSFETPEMSPYLAYLMRENIKLKARDAIYSRDSRRTANSFRDRPREVEIMTQPQDPNITNNRVEVRRVRLLDDSYYGGKSVSKNADQVSETNSLKFGNNLFKGDINCWLVKNVDSQTNREIFLPAAAFNMSKIAGLESVKYSLAFTGFDDTQMTKQEVKLVDDADIGKIINNSQDSPVYARMKVEGTSTWFVWYLR